MIESCDVYCQPDYTTRKRTRTSSPMTAISVLSFAPAAAIVAGMRGGGKMEERIERVRRLKTGEMTHGGHLGNMSARSPRAIPC